MVGRPGGRTALRWGLEPASYQVTARPVGPYSAAANHGSTDRKQGTKPAPKRVRPGPRPPEASSQRRKTTGDRCKETSGGSRARLQSGAIERTRAPVGSEAKASHRRSA